MRLGIEKQKTGTGKEIRTGDIKSLPKGSAHRMFTGSKHQDRIMDSGDREPDRRTEERRKNGKYCQIYIISSLPYNPCYMYHCLTLYNIHLASNALTILPIYNNGSIR